MKGNKKLMAIPLMIGCLLALTACSKTLDTRKDAYTKSTMQSIEEKNDSQQQNEQPEESSTTADSAVEEDNTPVDAEFSLEHAYSDMEKRVAILGLKEYKTIKTEKYTDKIAKNKRYLVMFLEIQNGAEETQYFNVNNLSAQVDGKKIKNTVLLNEPENYPTIFANIGAQTKYKGFVAWKVPKNWEKLEITYTGWQGEDALTLHSTLTKKDLKDPEDYS